MPMIVALALALGCIFTFASRSLQVGCVWTTALWGWCPKGMASREERERGDPSARSATKIGMEIVLYILRVVYDQGRPSTGG